MDTKTKIEYLKLWAFALEAKSSKKRVTVYTRSIVDNVDNPVKFIYDTLCDFGEEHDGYYPTVDNTLVGMWYSWHNGLKLPDKIHLR